MIFCGRDIKERGSMSSRHCVAVASWASLVVMGVLVVLAGKVMVGLAAFGLEITTPVLGVTE